MNSIGFISERKLSLKSGDLNKKSKFKKCTKRTSKTISTKASPMKLKTFLFRIDRNRKITILRRSKLRSNSTTLRKNLLKINSFK